MQHVNDDMDDIFKKAGEGYPLQSGMPDWDKVHHALNAQQEQKPAPKNKKKYLWLLCLLPLMFICNRYVYTGNNPDNAAVEKPAVAVVRPVQPTKKFHNSNIRNTTATSDNSITTIGPVANKKSSIREKHNHAMRVQNLTNAIDQTAGAQHHSPKKPQTPTGEKALYNTVEEKAIEQEPVPEKKLAGAINSLLINKTDTGVQALSLLDTIIKATTLHIGMHGTAGAIKSKSSLRYKKWFYAGITGSADLTSVRMQKTAKTGWQYGVLAGYAFRKKWSIEAGMFAGRKYYYTEGRYFNKSRTYLPPNSDITEVWGNCTMLEFPLALKYNLSSGPRAVFFATAGISSYIMKKEAYAYNYYYRSSGNYVIHSKTYRNASTNLFSVLQLSGGMQQGLGRRMALRVEPYAKLPLTGLGYGKLRFSSFGISAGLVRSFSRH